MGVVRRTGRWLIAEWREAWRFSSLWVASVGFGLLAVWDQLPLEIRQMLPDNVQAILSILSLIATIIARVTHQPESQAAIDAKRAAEQAAQEAGA